MSYVITDPCIGTCDTACVQVCPVDAIHGPIRTEELQAIPADERRLRLPTLQLFINPDECICCAACEPECPVQAIYPIDAVPAQWHDAIERNAWFFKPKNSKPTT